MINSFVFNLNRCTGCHACVLACSIENSLAPQLSLRKVNIYNEQRHSDAPVFYLSLACNHCSDPACMRCCPANAFHRDQATGAVILDNEKCIGCRYCSWACPFDALKFNSEEGVMEKCSFCNPLIEKGGEPACVALCPTGALGFSALEEDNIVNDIKGFPETACKPSIKLIPLRDRQPNILPPHNPAPFRVLVKPVSSVVTLRSEWILALFTLLVSILFAFMSASVFVNLKISAPAFMATALVAIGSSLLHLGKKIRAHRSVINFISSWLSREIILFFIFIALSAVYLLFMEECFVFGCVAVFFGLLALISVDQVYSVMGGAWPRNLHSSNLILTGPFLFGLLAGNVYLISVAFVFKLILYLMRKRASSDIASITSALRIGFGFIAPLVIVLIDASQLYIYIVLSCLVGEIIDRCEFYQELEVVTPANELKKQDLTGTK